MALSAKYTGNLRHPMHLCHPVLSSRPQVRHLLTYLWGSFDIFVGLFWYICGSLSTCAASTRAQNSPRGLNWYVVGLFWHVWGALLTFLLGTFVGLLCYICDFLIYLQRCFDNICGVLFTCAASNRAQQILLLPMISSVLVHSALPHKVGTKKMIISGNYILYV